MPDVKKKQEKHSKRDKERSSKEKSSRRDREKPSRSDKERSSKRDKESSSKHDKNDSTVELYCAIYEPHYGNYYHWAFTMNDPQTRRWHLSQVIQEEEDGEYIRSQLEVDPRNSSRCRQPLLWLGRMPASHWDWLKSEVAHLQVPGEADSWNCQDHVMEIWDLLRSWEVIDQATYNSGYSAMMDYYGPDLGGRNGDFGGEDEGDYVEEGYVEEEYEETGGRILSEEFVYDSEDID